MNHTYKFALNPHSHDEIRPFGLYQNDALDVSFDRNVIQIRETGDARKGSTPVRNVL